MINGIEYVLEKNWNNINALHGCDDGISFKSTINKRGVNILLFDSEICDCLEDGIYTKQITEINYEYK